MLSLIQQPTVKHRRISTSYLHSKSRINFVWKFYSYLFLENLEYKYKIIITINKLSVNIKNYKRTKEQNYRSSSAILFNHECKFFSVSSSEDFFSVSSSEDFFSVSSSEDFFSVSSSEAEFLIQINLYNKLWLRG